MTHFPLTAARIPPTAPSHVALTTPLPLPTRVMAAAVPVRSRAAAAYPAPNDREGNQEWNDMPYVSHAITTRGHHVILLGWGVRRDQHLGGKGSIGRDGVERGRRNH